jgi:hypothetical protein
VEDRDASSESSARRVVLLTALFSTLLMQAAVDAAEGD